MEVICQELNIPKKQIKETTAKNRYICIAHKNFLRNLVKHKKLGYFHHYPHTIDDWPQQKELEPSWEHIYLVV